MPPRKAAAQAAEPQVTVDSIYEAGERLASSEDEGDYKFLLGALKSGPSEKRAALQFIARYASKFPKQNKATIAAVKEAASDADEQVRLTVFKELGKFLAIDRAQVIEILFLGLGDSDEKVLALVKSQLKKIFASMPETLEERRKKVREYGYLVDALKKGQTDLAVAMTLVYTTNLRQKFDDTFVHKEEA